MSEAAPAPQAAADAAAPPAEQQSGDQAPGRVTELRVSAHVMTLDRGLFCVFPAPGSPAPEPSTGLPGVRITRTPSQTQDASAIDIATFRPDGWLDNKAALVNVTGPSAQILVSIYQNANLGLDAAPRLQVLKLNADAPAAAPPQPPVEAQAEPPAVPAATPDVVAHVQRSGDVGVSLGEWVGTKGSGQWVEGFGIGALPGIDPEDIEYQATLGRGWLSPWVNAGKFCGSRGMALPLLGITVRLKGKAAEAFDCSYAATFIDGSEVGPVDAGVSCEAESLAALESFQIDIRPKAQGTAARRAPAKAPAPRAAAPKAPARPRRR